MSVVVSHYLGNKSELERTDRQFRYAVADKRGRVSMATYGAQPGDKYEVHIGAQGAIVLVPIGSQGGIK